MIFFPSRFWGIVNSSPFFLLHRTTNKRRYRWSTRTALSREIVHQEKLSLSRETEGKNGNDVHLPIKLFQSITPSRFDRNTHCKNFIFETITLYEVNREFRFEFVIFYKRNISLFFTSFSKYEAIKFVKKIQISYHFFFPATTSAC